MLYKNLLIEFIRIGISEKQYESMIAEILKKSKKSVHNKILGNSRWTLEEMTTINDYFFNGEQTLNYLFQKFEPKTTTAKKETQHA